MTQLEDQFGELTMSLPDVLQLCLEALFGCMHWLFH